MIFLLGCLIYKYIIVVINIRVAFGKVFIILFEFKHDKEEKYTYLKTYGWYISHVLIHASNGGQK